MHPLQPCSAPRQDRRLARRLHCTSQVRPMRPSNLLTSAHRSLNTGLLGLYYRPYAKKGGCRPRRWGVAWFAAPLHRLLEIRQHPHRVVLELSLPDKKRLLEDLVCRCQNSLSWDPLVSALSARRASSSAPRRLPPRSTRDPCALSSTTGALTAFIRCCRASAESQQPSTHLGVSQHVFLNMRSPAV